VIGWWFLCAVDPACIAPTRDLYCQFAGRDVYGRCHRYDQSALNILLANYFDHQPQLYVLGGPPVLTVERGRHDHILPLYVCTSSSSSGGSSGLVVERVSSEGYL